MTKDEFLNVSKNITNFQFKTLHEIEYDDVGSFSVIRNDSEAILLLDHSIDFGKDQLHFAVNDLNIVIDYLQDKNDVLICFFPNDKVDMFLSKGYEIFGMWHDYFNRNISDYTDNEQASFLQPEDYVTASEITLACKDQTRGFMGSSTEWIKGWMDSNSDIIIKAGVRNNTILTHYEGSKMVGIICIGTYYNDEILWVRELAVLPAYQRRGIGEKLIRQALYYGHNKGAKKAFLHVDETNEGAISLYKRLGFNPSKEPPEINLLKVN